MVEKHGTWPANARVDVDYSKKKPKIKFTYPDNGDSAKKQAKKQNRFGPHTFILIFLTVLVTYYPLMAMQGSVGYPEECNLTERGYESNRTIIDNIKGTEFTIEYKAIYGYNITCDDKTYKIDFNRLDNPVNGQFAGFKNGDLHTKEILINFLLWLIIPIILFFIVNRIITNFLIKQKWYQRWLPKHQAEGWLKRKKKKYIKFTPEDVENNIVEIPLFSNIELDYKTNGEFSDKLVRIKIREHQYNKFRKGKIGKKKVELYKWYVRFYFKDKPKNGYLEVIFQ